MNIIHCSVTGADVDDTQMFILNDMHRHLEEPKAHARLLCADYFSTDNNTLFHHFIEILPPITAFFVLFRFSSIF